MEALTDLGERADRAVRDATPRLVGGVGGRFISRGRLAARSLYWLVWLTVSRRAAVGTGVQREMEALGLGALRLIVSASVLVGLIATFQIAYQLKLYSAQTLTPHVIGWFAARELGPLVAALLVVARSASAIGGELAAMGASAELDALRAMGLDPAKYLVAPKLAALLVSLPALTVLADALIPFGAWLGTTFVLGYSSSLFAEQFRSALDVRDVLVGLGKAVVFAFVVAIVPADEGLSVGRDVQAIGPAATRAVVLSLIAVLGADTVVNAVFYFIPALA